MTRAEQIQFAYGTDYMTWNEVLDEAAEVGHEFDQDWDNEVTYFEFPDKSVAVFFGKLQEIHVYGCRD